ncbi:MAG: hypothetical protein AAGE94_03510 [Acidobacteriota bacterium]
MTVDDTRASRRIAPILLAAFLATAPAGADATRTAASAGSEDGLPATVTTRGGTSTHLAFADHAYVNPFTGGVAWETTMNADRLSMEWAFIGVSDVLPLCAGAFDWTVVDTFLANVASRGHQAILRPVFFGPGYVLENYAPSDLAVADFHYGVDTFDNPRWDLASTQTCVLKFIDAFAARYKHDLRVAYIQMGLAGLWGEHHLDGGPYTASSFPSTAFQKTMISRYLSGFGSTSSDLLVSISLDAAQAHGFFSSPDATFDHERVGFFDDSLLIANHKAAGNWRQQQHPVDQLLLHKRHGWGGEAYWTGCNEDGSWVVPPNDCGNGESLGDQAARLGLNYMLGHSAFASGHYSSAALLAASQQLGYKFTATAATRQDAGHVAVTVENTGVAQCPYRVQVCTAEGCAGDLSTLAPGISAVVIVPASVAASQDLFFRSPRLDPNSALKIRWSNVGADGPTGTLTIVVDSAVEIFTDDFESRSTDEWSSTRF